MESVQPVRLTQFGGDQSEWADWKDRFEAMLEVQGISEGLSRPKPADGTPERPEWDRRNRRLHSMLVLNTRAAASDVVRQATKGDGLEAYQKLIAKYEEKSTVRAMSLSAELFNSSVGEAEDPDDYFRRIEEIQGQLNAMNCPVPDNVLQTLVMTKLPAAYHSLVTAINTRNYSYEEMKTQVQSYYQLNLARSGASSTLHRRDVSSEGVLHAADSSRVCYSCGKPGHISANCRRRNSRRDGGQKGPVRPRFGTRAGARDKSNVKCYKCGRMGHYKSDCRGGSAGTAPRAQTAAEEEVLTAVEALRATPTGDGDWIVDSGATTHMATSATGMINVRKQAGQVIVGGGTALASVGVGDLPITVRDSDGQDAQLLLRDALIVPQMGKNLLSVTQIGRRGGSVLFDGAASAIITTRRRIPIRQSGKMFVIQLATTRPWRRDTGADESADAPAAAYTASELAELWHRRLGHRNWADVQALSRLDSGVPEGLGDKIAVCDVCQVSKHKRHSFPSESNYRAKQKLELVHTDLLTVDTPSMGSNRYAIIFTDDFTRMRWVYFMKSKSDTLSCMKQLHKDIARLYKLRIQGIRADHGGEFVAGAVREYLKDEGITLQFSAPYAPQQNGVAERSWQTVMDMARCLLEDAGLAKTMWCEAVRHAVYLLNRMPTKALGGDTPYHAWYGRHARLDYLKTWGARAWVQQENRRKLDNKAWRGVMVGCDTESPAYRIYDPVTRKVVHTIHVTFDEERDGGTVVSVSRQKLSNGTDEKMDDDDNDVNDMDDLEPRISGNKRDSSGRAPGLEPVPPGQLTQAGSADFERNQRSQPAARRSDRGRMPRECMDWTCPLSRPHTAHVAADDNMEYAFAAAAGISPDPATIAEALSAPDADQWRAAMESEYQSLDDAGTWELCELPEGKNIVGSRWIFKKKLGKDGTVSRYKARLVAQGFSQVLGQDYEETYAPVARLTSIRTILAFAAKHNLDVDQMDVETAYLNAPVAEEIYLRQPAGMEREGPNGEKLVCRLKKSLYGLKQSARNWNVTIDTWLTDYGFIASDADPCVYGLRDDTGGASSLLVTLYVDDLMIVGRDRSVLDQFKSDISQAFKMKDMGPVSYLLGMEIQRDCQEGFIELRQTSYVKQVLNTFGMGDCKPVGAPAEQAKHLPPAAMTTAEDTAADPAQGASGGITAGKAPDPKEYMKLVGCLLWAAMVTRPDIAFAVQKLSRHLQDPRAEDWSAGKRVLRYLAGTTELGIIYRRHRASIMGQRPTGCNDLD